MCSTTRPTLQSLETLRMDREHTSQSPCRATAPRHQHAWRQGGSDLAPGVQADSQLLPWVPPAAPPIDQIITSKAFQGARRVYQSYFRGKQCDVETSLVAQTAKHLPTVWETRVQSLGQEDLLEEEMTTHSSILAWKIAWTEPGRATVHGVAKSWTRLRDFTSLV